MKFNIGDLVLVTWEDHYNDHRIGWKLAKEYKLPPLFIETVGFVVADNKNRVGLVPTLDDDGVHEPQYAGGVSVRMKRDIKSVQVLRKAGK